MAGRGKWVYLCEIDEIDLITPVPARRPGEDDLPGGERVALRLEEALYSLSKGRPVRLMSVPWKKNRPYVCEVWEERG